MLILKGAALGSVMLLVFTILYFRACGMFGTTGAVTADAFRSITFGNYLFWIVVALCFSLGFTIVAIWPKFT